MLFKPESSTQCKISKSALLPQPADVTEVVWRTSVQTFPETSVSLTVPTAFSQPSSRRYGQDAVA